MTTNEDIPLFGAMQTTLHDHRVRANLLAGIIEDLKWRGYTGLENLKNDLSATHLNLAMGCE